MKYVLLENLTTTDVASLNILIKKCDGYEPFFCSSSDSDETSYYTQLAAFDESEMVSFLCLFCIDEDNHIYELSGMTAPDYRGSHHFSKLLSMAIDAVTVNGEATIIAPITDNIKNFRCCENLAYTEYMFCLSKSDFMNSESTVKPAPDTFSVSDSCSVPDVLSVSDINRESEHPAVYTNSPEIEFVFSEDFDTYMCYLDASADEPCAVLNLDFQDSFTNVYGVYVDENLRGQGFGSLLMKHFLYDYFNDEDLAYFYNKHTESSVDCMPPLVLNVRSTNTPALKLYKKCGFTEVSHIDYHYIKCI